MRELDRPNDITEPPAPALKGPSRGEHSPRLETVAIIGSGRVGTLLSQCLSKAGLVVTGPLGRGDAIPYDVDLVLICTPDSEIINVANAVPENVAIGHCSGAHGAELLPSGRRTLAFHPLMTVTSSTTPSSLEGAWAAVDGSDVPAVEMSEVLARLCGMKPVRIAPANRAAYHAAASIASNFLVTLENAAERIAATAGLPREALLPLIQACLLNWSELGSAKALTGPVARGDRDTVARQRQAIAETNSDLLPLFDTLCEATEALAAGGATS